MCYSSNLLWVLRRCWRWRSDNRHTLSRNGLGHCIVQLPRALHLGASHALLITEPCLLLGTAGPRDSGWHTMHFNFELPRPSVSLASMLESSPQNTAKL